MNDEMPQPPASFQRLMDAIDKIDDARVGAVITFTPFPADDENIPSSSACALPEVQVHENMNHDTRQQLFSQRIAALGDLADMVDRLVKRTADVYGVHHMLVIAHMERHIMRSRERTSDPMDPSGSVVTMHRLGNPPKKDPPGE